MAYLHSAFIENTPEAREWLESVGFSICACATFRNSLLLVAYAPLEISKGNAHGVGYDSAFKDEPEKEIEFYLHEAQKYGSAVDCRGNLPLFKAITALRDDSDYMQWYIENKWIETGIGGQMVGSELRRKIGEQWYLYLNNDSKMTERIKMDIEYSHNGVSDFRKATLEELIEHFKTKKI